MVTKIRIVYMLCRESAHSAPIPALAQAQPPKKTVVELFKRKERIGAATGLDETDLRAMLHTLLERIRFFLRALQTA
jgi:hypothetical protein